MDKRKEFMEKMEELLMLGKEIEEEEIFIDKFVEEVAIICDHIDVGMYTLKKIEDEKNEQEKKD